VRHQRGLPTPEKGDWNRVEMGESGVFVNERRAHVGGAPGDMHISGAGMYTPHDASKPGLDKKITDLGKQLNLSEQDTAAMLRQFATTQQFPTGIPEKLKKSLSITSYLLFSRENIRNAGEMAFSAMTVDRIERGDLTWKQAFNIPGHLPKTGDPLSAGGENPMSFRGSSWAGADLEAGAVPESVTSPADRARRERAMEELRKREIAMGEKWLAMRMRADKLEYFKDETAAREWIYDRLLQFFRINKQRVPG
jgi:hypothetical protein